MCELGLGRQPYMLNTRRRRIKHDIIFRLGLFYEYSNLEYVPLHVIYRVNQAEYGIRILVAASQEYVNTYSTCRKPTRGLASSCLYSAMGVNPRPYICMYVHLYISISISISMSIYLRGANRRADKLRDRHGQKVEFRLGRKGSDQHRLACRKVPHTE